MPILVEILLLIAGLILVVLGADALVDGASSVAKRLGVSEFVIGLVIVGFGTSCPELVVSLTGAFKGNADISVGNVVGSNIFNTLLILGLTAVVAPVAVTSSNSRKDIPLALLISFLFVFLAVQGDGISRFEGILFLLLFIHGVGFPVCNLLPKSIPDGINILNLISRVDIHSDFMPPYKFITKSKHYINIHKCIALQ